MSFMHFGVPPIHSAGHCAAAEETITLRSIRQPGLMPDANAMCRVVWGTLICVIRSTVPLVHFSNKSERTRDTGVKNADFAEIGVRDER